MARELHCRDVGPDCDAVVVAEKDEDVIMQVAEHSWRVHGMSDEATNDPAFLAHVREQIHDLT